MLLRQLADPNQHHEHCLCMINATPTATHLLVSYHEFSVQILQDLKVIRTFADLIRTLDVQSPGVAVNLSEPDPTTLVSTDTVPNAQPTNQPMISVMHQQSEPAGVSSVVLAYGATRTGKSFSLLGTSAEEGLIARLGVGAHR